MAEKAEQKKSPAPSTGTGLLTQAESAAQSAASRSSGERVAGPFEVGNIGHVSVVKREMGDQSYLYAEFTGTGRPARIPLAAVATLAEKLD